MNSKTYAVGRSRIKLRFGDITQSKAQVLVSSDDYLLSMGGGVSAALRRAGGPAVPADASKMVPAKLGNVVVSSAGDLPARYILHAVTIGESRQEMAPATIVRQTTQHAMQLLAALNCSSIAFPAIGGGVAGIPYETVAAEMASALVSSLIEVEASYDVELYLMDRFSQLSREGFFVFFEQFAARQLGLATSPAGSTHLMSAPTGAKQGMNAEESAQAQRRHQVYNMLRHLEGRRNQLEADLLKVLTSGDAKNDSALADLKAQLDQIQSLRRGYETELLPQDQAPQRVLKDSIFVSSTSVDLAKHRKAIREAIERLQLKYVGMEDFAATGQAPAELIRQKVVESEAYVGIIGMRYGYVDPGTGLSMTELEYRQALASAKPIHMFVMDDGADITAGMVESDSVRFARLLEFKSRIMKDHTCVLYTSASDLARKAEATLKHAS
jgi:O-acetyl-ADP-ribose deacetylase (regulator of RNase III)